MSKQANGENVHALKFRETKQSQGRPSAPVADLFRLDERTIVGKALSDSFFQNSQ